jgi:hypothetical protein
MEEGGGSRLGTKIVHIVLNELDYFGDSLVSAVQSPRLLSRNCTVFSRTEIQYKA